MLELYKGQISLEELKTMPHKELLLLRDARIKRLEKEHEQLQNGGKKDEVSTTGTSMTREEAREAILKDLSMFHVI